MTGAGAGLRWVLDALGRSETLGLDELQSVYDTSEWRRGWSLEREHEELCETAKRVAPFEILSLQTGGPESESAVVLGADGKRWSITAWGPPGDELRVTGVRVVAAPPEGTVIRDADDADALPLAELERRSPLRLGEGGAILMTFDRGDDYFASARLMEEATIYVAEVGGGLAGVYWGAQQPVRIGGAERRLFLEMHVRIDPEAPRGGVFWALCNYGRERYARSSDSIAFWVSPENLAIRKFTVSAPSWSVQGLRALIPCAAGAVPVGRRATPGDAGEVTDILNACHGRSELFLPYTDRSLAGRLARDPAQYGWEHVRIHGGAAVGVGGARLLVTRQCGGDRRETRRALALDHGCVAGAEDDYEALLRSSASSLGEEGVTHLAVFTSEGSSTYAVVTALAEEIEPFDLWTFDIDEPPATAERGLYVDPVYF